MFLAKESVDRSVQIVRHLRSVANDQQFNAVLSQLTANRERPMVVSWLNANVFNLARANTDLAAYLLESDLLLRDGAGISLLFRSLGRDAGANMNGTDCIPNIVSLYAGRRVALLGTREPYLSRAKEVIERLGGIVVLKMDGFQESQAYSRQLAEQDVDLVIMGMGVPKQERVSIHIAEHVAKPMLILNGGAVLDFMAGRFPRAPKLWRRLRLEWLYRLIQEPKRLWRRYIIGIPVFIFNMLILIYAIRSRPISVASTRERSEHILSGALAEQEE